MSEGKPQRQARRRGDRKFERTPAKSNNEEAKTPASTEPKKPREMIDLVKYVPDDLESLFTAYMKERKEERAKRIQLQKEKEGAEEEAEEAQPEENADEVRVNGCSVSWEDAGLHFRGPSQAALNRAWNNVRNNLLQRFEAQMDSKQNLYVLSNKDGPYVFPRAGSRARVANFRFQSRGEDAKSGTALKKNGLSFTSSYETSIQELLSKAGDGKLIVRNGSSFFTLEHLASEEIPEDQTEGDEEQGEEQDDGEEGEQKKSRRPRRPRRQLKEFDQKELQGWAAGTDFTLRFNAAWQASQADLLQSFLADRGYGEGEEDVIVEVKSVSEGAWTFSYFRWVPKSEEEVEEQEEGDDDSADDNAGDDDNEETTEKPKKKRRTGSWVAIDRLDDLPRRTQGLGIYLLGGRPHGDIELQVVEPAKGEKRGKFESELLEVLNSDAAFSPRMKRNAVANAVSFLVAECNVIRIQKLNSPCGSYVAQFRRVSGTNPIVSFIWNTPPKDSASSVTSLIERISDWNTLLRIADKKIRENAQPKKRKQPTSTSSASASVRGTAFYTKEELQELPVAKLKTLYFQHKKQQELAHHHWISALNDARKAGKPRNVKGKGKGKGKGRGKK